jgi:glycosyltransferase involved in cell wall biosynthesis
VDGDGPRRRPSRPVLLLVDHLRENGGTRVVHDAVRRLPTVGVPAELFVLLPVPAGVPQVVPGRDVRVRYGVPRPMRLRRALLPGLLRLVGAARRSSVVVSGSETGYALLVGWVAARLTGRPFVVLVQSSIDREMAEWVPPRLQGSTRWVLGHADRSVVVSPGLVADVLATGQTEERVSVVPVGVDVDIVLAAGRRVSPALVVRPPFVVAAGRLTPQKGFDVLLRAYRQVCDRMDAPPLVILGDGPDRGALTTLVEDLGLRDVVHLPGFRDDVQAHLAAARLFVLPSRYEGMGGLVLLEALAHGLPVVATDCPSGPREVLADGELGRLVPVEDSATLADAIVDELTGPPRGDPDARVLQARRWGPDRWVPQLARAVASVTPRD